MYKTGALKFKQSIKLIQTDKAPFVLRDDVFMQTNLWIASFKTTFSNLKAYNLLMFSYITDVIQ